MRDEVRDRLRAAFAAPRAPGGPAPAPEAPPDAFVRAFLLRAERVVAPALDELGRVLESHGRFFSVEIVGERRNGRGLAVPASVQLNVFRRHRTTNFKNGAPRFNVVCDRAGRRALFQRSLPGSGPVDLGACALEALTRDRVQAEAAASLDALARA